VRSRAGIAHRARGALEADGGDLVAPGIDGRECFGARRVVDDLQEVALLADRRRVERTASDDRPKNRASGLEAAPWKATPSSAASLLPGWRAGRPCRRGGTVSARCSVEARALLAADHGEVILGGH